MKISKPERLTVNIPSAKVTPGMFKRLKKAADLNGVSVSEVIRQALGTFLASESSEQNQKGH